jgi:hypothetical protein
MVTREVKLPRIYTHYPDHRGDISFPITVLLVALSDQNVKYARKRKGGWNLRE